MAAHTFKLIICFLYIISSWFLYSMERLDTIKLLDTHMAPIYSSVITRNTIVTFSKHDQGIKIWDSRTGILRGYIRPSSGYKAAEVSDENIILGFKNGNIMSFNLHNIACDKTKLSPTQVCCTLTDTSLTHGNQEAQICDPFRCRPVKYCQLNCDLVEGPHVHFGNTTLVAVEKNRVVVALSKQKIKVWNTSSGRLIHDLAVNLLDRTYGCEPNKILMSNGRLIVNYQARGIMVWDLESGKLLYNLHHKGSGWPYEMKVCRDYLLGFALDNQIIIWGLSTGTLLEIFSYPFYKLSVSCKSAVAGFHHNGSLEIINTHKKNKYNHLVMLNCFKSVEITGNNIITLCRDKMIRVWDIATKKLMCVIGCPYIGCKGIAVSNNRLIACFEDGTVRMCDLNDITNCRDKKDLCADLDSDTMTMIMGCAERHNLDIVSFLANRVKVVDLSSDQWCCILFVGQNPALRQFTIRDNRAVAVFNDGTARLLVDTLPYRQMLALAMARHDRLGKESPSKVLNKYVMSYIMDKLLKLGCFNGIYQAVVEAKL